MTSEELKKRTKRFSKDVIILIGKLPRSMSADVLSKQVVRSATSVGANYRSACRARSKADFVSKITIVEEEADETQYWLELFEETEIHKSEDLKRLINEASELTAIFTAIGKTSNERYKKKI